MKNGVQNPGDVIDVTAPVGGYTSGALALIGTQMVGVPVTSAAAGEKCAVAIKNRTVEHDAVAADAWEVGDQLYRNTADGKLTDTATSNVKAGRAAAAKAAAATKATLILNQP